MQRREFTKLLGGLSGVGLAGGAAATETGFDPDLNDDPLEEITIETTEYDESHIYVGDPEDTDSGSLYALGYGNGYVQARDRLFQMEIIRHIGYGNSAELLGPAQLPSDIQVRRDLYSPEEIRRQWESASGTIKTVVRGYADGVNRRMTELAAQGELPAEFAALGHAPEPWKPEDTVACINYLIGFFGVGGGAELGNAKSLAALKDAFGDEGADDHDEAVERDAFAAYADLNWLRSTDDHFTSIPGDDLTVEDIDPALIEEVPDYEDVPDRQLELIDAAQGAETWGIETEIDLPEDVTMGLREGQGVMSGFKWGSNAFVIDGDLTETGTPMLGGGPQMGLFKPPIPYEIGLHGAGVDMTGMGVPGAPAEVIGRTDSLAWTVTSGRDDQVDTIAVELDPDDKHRYKWEGDWYEMETETVVHRASPIPPAQGGEADVQVVEQEVARIEQDGDSMPVVAWNPEENVAWCQRITTRFDELPGAFIWADLARTDSLDEFEEGLAEFPFTFNFHVAEYSEDDDGNVETNEIAYFHTGKIPRRDGDADPRFPAIPEEHAWTEMRVGTGLGTVDRDPSRGYYVNWNNGPAKGWRAGDGEQNWGSRHRVETLDHFIREKLGVPEGVPDGKPVKKAAKDRLSVADVRDIEYQAAKHDSTAQVSAPYLADAAADAADLQDVARVLREWIDDYCPWAGDADDGVGAGTMDYPGHAVFDRARHALQERVFDDELGGLQGTLALDPVSSRHASDHGNATSDVTFLDALAGETTHDWFADTSGDAGLQSPDPKTRDELLRSVLRDVKADLVDEYGSDPEDWADPGHTSKFLSLGLSNQTVIHIQSRSTYNQAIDLGKFNSEDPAVWQANCQDVVPPGNSGHVNAAEGAQVVATGTEPERLHDQLAIYAENGPYKPHPHTREQVQQVAVESTSIRATPEHEFTPVVPAAPRPLPFPVDVPDADAPSGPSGDESGDPTDQAAESGEEVTGETAGETTDDVTGETDAGTTADSSDDGVEGAIDDSTSELTEQVTESLD